MSRNDLSQQWHFAVLPRQVDKLKNLDGGDGRPLWPA